MIEIAEYVMQPYEDHSWTLLRQVGVPTRPDARLGRAAVRPKARAGGSTVSLVTAIAQPPCDQCGYETYIRPRSRGRHRGFRGLDRLVGTGWVFGERIAGGCEGAGPRAAAEFSVRAPPAAAAEVCRSDAPQERVHLVDADDLVVLDVTE